MPYARNQEVLAGKDSRNTANFDLAMSVGELVPTISGRQVVRASPYVAWFYHVFGAPVEGYIKGTGSSRQLPTGAARESTLCRTSVDFMSQ